MAIASSGGYVVAMENENTVELPRPTWFHVVLALLVMLIATIRLSAALIEIEDDPLFISYPVFYGGCALVLLVTQYGSTFRRWKSGTLIAIGLLSFLLLWSFIGLVTLTIQFAVNRTASDQLLTYMVFVVLAPLTAWAIQANWKWYQTLVAFSRQHESHEPPKSFSLLELLGVTFVLACTIGPVSYRAGTNQSLYVENVPRAETPFAVSDKADQIKFRRERDGTIRAYWIESPSILEKWLQKQEERPEVVHFSINKQEEVWGTEPIPRTKYGSVYDHTGYWAMNIATWQVGIRTYEVRWPPLSDPLDVDVYYYETDRD